MDNTTTIGGQGETLACRYLQRHGYTIITRNWRCPRGEIDIIARRDARTAIVEVKTRTGLGYGHPFESITPPKLARLRLLALEWARQKDVGPGSLRLDAIAVTLVPHQPAIYEHLEGIG